MADRIDAPLFSEVRICLNGRWLTDAEVKESVAKGRKWADALQAAGELPHRPK